jgi:hypothetical protein
VYWRLFVVFVALSGFLLPCGPSYGLAQTQHEKKYRNYLVLENRTVLGVTNQTTEDGKYIPIELKGQEKVTALLIEFIMKDDVTVDMLGPGGTKYIFTNILQDEKEYSSTLLANWSRDTNPQNRGKAAYLLAQVAGSVTPLISTVSPSAGSSASDIRNTELPRMQHDKSRVNLPRFDLLLRGTNEVRIKNPNDISVTVGLRSGNQGKDFEVPSNGGASVYVPNGTYEIYFVYSNKQNALFRGDDFSLNDNGVEIQIVTVLDGNYGIRQVK